MKAKTGGDDQHFGQYRVLHLFMIGLKNSDPGGQYKTESKIQVDGQGKQFERFFCYARRNNEELGGA